MFLKSVKLVQTIVASSMALAVFQYPHMTNDALFLFCLTTERMSRYQDV